jgi:putative ABC transport system permease protein
MCPPKHALRFLRWFCREDYLEEIEGNLIELFEYQHDESPAKAKWSFIWGVIMHFRPAFIKSFKVFSPQNTTAMFHNYFKIALRLFARNRLISAINVLGLALALTGSLLITIFIQDELSYDDYHANADHIYRVTRNFLSPDGSENLHLGVIAPPFGPLLKNDFPDIKEVARTWGFDITMNPVEENGLAQESIYIENFFYAEPSVFKIFSIPTLAGDTKTPLEDPYTMMVSDATAKKYFGTQDVVGKQLKGGEVLFKITGVFQSFPEQSHWHPDVLVAFSTLNDQHIYGRQRLENSWTSNTFGTYILVNDQFDPKQTEEQFPAFLDKHMGQTGNPKQPSDWTNLFLQPLTSIHLHSQLDYEIEANGNIDHVYIMGAIGIFLLLIACFNFINLSTARATTRGKEVGLRKVLGAFRKQLITQHLSESIFTASLAFLLAIFMISLSIPWFNDFTGKSIQLPHYVNLTNILVILGLMIGVGIMAGYYPALVISRFTPALSLKGQHGSGKGNRGIRRVLVVVQFTISIIMIIATFIVYQQLNFLNNRELGYAKDQIVTIYYDDAIAERYETFHHELTKVPSIKYAGRSSLVPTERLTAMQGTSIQQGDSLIATDIVMKDVRIDHEFFDTYQIPIVSGRNFSKEIKSDDSLGFIINETAARMAGWTHEEAVGQVLKNGPVKGSVIGVVKDFHFESLHESIVPIVFHGHNHMFNYVSVLVSASEMQEALAHIEAVWKEFVPDQPFAYSFLSDHYRRLYDSEQRQSELFMIFAGLAIFIAAMGLFGLATFNTLQRLKEVSIRKVLGASIASLLQLLSQEILLLIFLANLMAWPIAWYFMNEWLSGFAYRIEMTWWMFALAGLFAVIVALCTITSQSIKAALSNPADTLRNE